MVRVLLALLLIGCAQTPKSETYSSAAEIPVEVFFRNPVLSGYYISPDGKQLSVLKSWKNRLNVFVHPVGAPEKAKQVTFVEDRDIRLYGWKGENHIWFMKDNGGDENYHVFLVDLKTGQTRDATPFPGVRAEVIDDLRESSSTDLLIVHNQRDKTLFDVYRLNVTNGELKMVAENKYQIVSWVADHEGHPRAGVASDGVNSVLYYQAAPDQPMKAILKTDFRSVVSPIAFTADNKRLFVASNLGSDLIRIVEIDPAKPRKVLRTVYTHKRYDVSSGTYSEVRKDLGSVQVVTDRRETTFLHPDDQKDWEYVKSQFPEFGLYMSQMSRDERLWVVRTYADVSRGAYYLFERDSRKLTPLGELSPWLRADQLSPMKTVTYKSRDGLEIQGYLTLPRGKEAKNLPVVINPHGGPWARDEWWMNSEVQFLASRGYAVFQMNFRGSTGYGRKFWEASFKQWGRKMQDDITDGVNWLVKEGYADPKRVCIYGGSYGGYATLMGITKTPDLYACAVDYVGVSNMFTFMKTIPPYWKPWLEQMYVMVGHPEKEQKMLREVSPVFHVDKIKAPLFVAQGAKDPRVNIEESNQIVEALRKRGVEVQYMVKENEGHGFHNEENRFDFYRAMEKFLAEHLREARQ